MQPLMNSLKRLIYKEKKPLFSDFILSGRGSKIRTHDPRFWRPMLYQLSYTPIIILRILDTQICTINQELFYKKPHP